MTARIPKPRVVAFELTRRCPLSCLHCRASAEAQRQDLLSTEQCLGILEGLARYNKAVVILTGGEPMLRADLEEIIRYGREIGHRISMAACGCGFDDAAADRLKNAGLMSLSFSIDGPDAQSHNTFRGAADSFQTVLSAIDAAKKTGIPFQINTTITLKNHQRLEDIAALATGLGAVCWNPFILVPTGRAENIRDLSLSPRLYENVLEHLVRLKQNLPIGLRVTCGPQFARLARQEKLKDADKISGCLAATEFAFISYAGDVQTCGFLDIPAGNLIENDFDFRKIWETSPMLNDLRDIKNYKGACRQCASLAVCRGCRARAFAQSGDYLQQDPICMLAQRGAATDETTA